MIKSKDIKATDTFSRGNISILSLAAVVIFAFLFLLVIDCSRIFIARSASKKAADSAVLAVAQDLMFFEREHAANTAKVIAYENGCNLVNLSFTYDEVEISMEKTIDFVFLGFIALDSYSVRSVSKSKLLYPWDDVFNLCKSYRFDYLQ